MVTNNKILTVSYGTFSCTLEGFDESFETMKAIAEYFRDLASDDRYFGAEPPQPDAEMLTRIAQREIERRVEARQDDKGIHLRAETPALAVPSTPRTEEPPAATSPPLETASAEPVAEASVADQTDAVPAATDAVAEPDAPEVTEAQEADPGEDVSAVAEDVMVEDKTAATEEPVRDDTRAAAEQAEPEAVTEEETIAEEEAVAEDRAEPAPEAVAEVSDATPHDASEQIEDLGEEPAFLDAEPVPEAEATAPDSIAAKLARIRAVVARKGAESEEYSEDQHAYVLDADQTEEVAGASDEDMTGDASAAAGLAAAMDHYDDEQDAASLQEDSPDAASSDDSPATSPVDAPAEPDSPAEPVAAEEHDTADEDEDDGDDEITALFDDLDDDEDDGEHENLLADVAAEAPVRPRARVLKVKRSELEEAIASGMIEEVEDDEDGEDDSDETGLSPEEEADLMRELAEVEAEFAQPAAAPAVAPEARPVLGAAIDEGDEHVSRLMAAAGDKLDEPETTTNRETYSHMRAAVAATRARIEAGHDPREDDGDSAYREDLAEVVRPRRPEARGTVRPRSSARPKSAPLKLVAEQRIDAATVQVPRGPVRPRRVASVEPEVAETAAEGFAEFAREMGAVELHELLEAAAAYMSFVEGRDQFSRPQLMTKVRQSGAAGFNREDGLRSFGQLLREGKIEKIGGGRFTASDAIGFRPDARAVG